MVTVGGRSAMSMAEMAYFLQFRHLPHSSFCHLLVSKVYRSAYRWVHPLLHMCRHSNSGSNGIEILAAEVFVTSNIFSLWGTLRKGYI